jgi:hypothetical protein
LPFEAGTFFAVHLIKSALTELREVLQRIVVRFIARPSIPLYQAFDAIEKILNGVPIFGIG